MMAPRRLPELDVGTCTNLAAVSFSACIGIGTVLRMI